MEMTMSKQHQHASFDRFPKLREDLIVEFGAEGIDATVERFIAAEAADFAWEGRFAEMNLGRIEGFDDEGETFERVAVMGYFRGGYYVAECVVDRERNAHNLLKSRRFESQAGAESAFIASS